MHRKARWVAVLMLLTVGARADYMNITIDGDASDWASVSTIATDPADNPGTIDFLTLQVANDENFLYIRYTLAESVNPQGGSGVFLAIDEDNNVATGFDIYGLGIVGSEAGWQNDFPFEQATGNFNTGNGLSGATYAAAPYNTATFSVEISIPRTATHTVGGAPIIPADGQTIRVAVWNQEASGDILGGAYTLSAVPEPASVMLMGMGGLMIAWRTRRRPAA
jgi:hypothetical protein